MQGTHEAQGLLSDYGDGEEEDGGGEEGGGSASEVPQAGQASAEAPRYTPTHTSRLSV